MVKRRIIVVEVKFFVRNLKCLAFSPIKKVGRELGSFGLSKKSLTESVTIPPTSPHSQNLPALHFIFLSSSLRLSLYDSLRLSFSYLKELESSLKKNQWLTSRVQKLESIISNEKGKKSVNSHSGKPLRSCSSY